MDTYHTHTTAHTKLAIVSILYSKHNFVHNHSVSQCNVKAIVGWKSTQNGDPLVDVASFLAMFLQPVDYGYHYLQDLDLFMGKYYISHKVYGLISFNSRLCL